MENSETKGDPIVINTGGVGFYIIDNLNGLAPRRIGNKGVRMERKIS